jgi:hypothetical protein
MRLMLPRVSPAVQRADRPVLDTAFSKIEVAALASEMAMSRTVRPPLPPNHYGPAADNKLEEHT